MARHSAYPSALDANYWQNPPSADAVAQSQLHVPFYISSRGLQASPIPFGQEIVDIEFDFISHRLVCRASTGSSAALELKPMSVASFYREVTSIFERLAFPVLINLEPSEVSDPIPFDQDRANADYDPSAVHRFWRALVKADGAFKLFRTGFIGKASPVHLFGAGSTWPSHDFPEERQLCIPVSQVFRIV
jgi:hypothetical protein